MDPFDGVVTVMIGVGAVSTPFEIVCNMLLVSPPA
jgi:hypothetical protein